jgi:uncharacterized membrane protein YqjE
MNERTSFTRWTRWLAPVAMVWLLLGAILVLQLWPDLPSTRRQWALLLVMGPPLYVLGELACAWLFSQSRSYAKKRFSITRIALALPIAIAWFALAWWLASFIGPQR